uniref:Putative secreted protein n=1 Tax=Ixodes ricinus TaxID=34613 RepID=A0A147BJV9_IXORI
MAVMSAIVLFSRSVIPFVCELYAVIRRWLVWLSRRIFCVSCAKNDDPGSVISTLEGTMPEDDGLYEELGDFHSGSVRERFLSRRTL